MKDFLIGVGIGFAVGAIMCKTCKPVADAVQKGKKLVEEKIQDSKDFTKELKEMSETNQPKKSQTNQNKKTA